MDSRGKHVSTEMWESDLWYKVQATIVVFLESLYLVRLGLHWDELEYQRDYVSVISSESAYPGEHVS